MTRQEIIDGLAEAIRDPACPVQFSPLLMAARRELAPQDVPPSHPDGPDPKIGDDLSYYLGPDAKCATAEQCVDLYRSVMEAARTTAGASAEPRYPATIQHEDIDPADPFDDERNDIAPCPNSA